MVQVRWASALQRDELVEPDSAQAVEWELVDKAEGEAVEVTDGETCFIKRD